MKILHVNPVLNVKKGGGTADRNVKMIQYLSEIGIECSVLTLGLGEDYELPMGQTAGRHVTLPVLWRRYFVPWPYLFRIYQSINNCDLVHMMSHWTVLNAVVFIFCRIMGKPYVICPAGALIIFGRSQFFKKVYQWLIGRAILKNARLLIAITEAEATFMQELGFNSRNIVIIPNGVEIPKAQEHISSIPDRFDMIKKPFALFVGRLNPIKGIDMLVDAFVQKGKQIADLQLVVAGPDEGLGAELKAKIQQHDLARQVHFLGFLGKAEREALYQQAEFLVIPSRSEAMSIVVLEAGVFGTPSMFTDQCGLGFLAKLGLGLEVNADAVSIAEGLLQMHERQLFQDRKADIASYVRENFAWPVVALTYKKYFEQITKDATC